MSEIPDFFHMIAQAFTSVQFSAPTAGPIIAFFLALLFLLVSAFVSASEIAFFSLSPSDLQDIEERKHRSDEGISMLLDNSERLLATILICNNFVNISIVMLMNYSILCVVSFGTFLWLEYLVMTVFMTFLLLLFGEVIPKIYSAQHALAFCRFSAPGLDILSKIFYPLSYLLVRSKVVTRRLIRNGSQSLTVDDLEKAMELTDQKDIAQESSMLHGIIRFGGEMAKEIMTSRMDVVDLDIDTPFPEVLQYTVQNNYSRIPVYQGTRDNVKGVLYLKDLLPHIGKPANFRWQSLIRPPYFVPETKMIDGLLRDFQKNKVHIAIVVDEFGGTSGIVTMEDIIEEIVGEIKDEYDDEESPYERLNKNTYIFEAKTLLSDFTRLLDLDEDYFEEVPGDADTLAGLLLEIKGEFPALRERIRYRELTFEVMKMDDRRIVSIKVVCHKCER